MKWNSFFPLCVAVSLHIFIPFRILISFFTSCFVRYICFALCLVDKTHKIDLKKNLGSLFLSSFASARIFMWHYIEPFSTRSSFSTHYFFLPFVEWRFFARNWSLKYSGRNIQNSKPIKKLKHFEWLHCLFSIEFSWQETLSNSIQFLQMIKWEWKKVIPNYAIKIAFLQFNPKYLPQHH